MITKDGKIFGKINIFDLVALLLAAVLVFGVSYRLLVLKRDETAVDITYHLVIKNVRDVTVNSFFENSPVFDYKSDSGIGTITKVEKEQARAVMKLLDGSVVNAPIDERFDMTVSVKAKATKQGDGTLMIGKTKIIDGLELKASTQKGNCMATIRDVR
ncbi:MAG: hypothetical protein BGN88_10680 [Clostridiales bacterium 43-6]|nr:MAG: hypothetical protein BGN88_10680 [Clostridiales bacterium 43-6]